MLEVGRAAVHVCWCWTCGEGECELGGPATLSSRAAARVLGAEEGEHDPWTNGVHKLRTEGECKIRRESMSCKGCELWSFWV